MLAQLTTRLLSYLAVRLLSEAFIVDLILAVARKAADSTDWTFDDDLVALLEKHLKKG